MKHQIEEITFWKAAYRQKIFASKGQTLGDCAQQLRQDKSLKNLNTQFIVRVHLKRAICQAMQVLKL